MINKVVAAQAFNEEGELVDLDKLKEARGIQAGIFLGSIFFLWLPWFVLRRRGDKAMENALTNFNMSDQAKGAGLVSLLSILASIELTQRCAPQERCRT